jgi:hypothetical protein
MSNSVKLSPKHGLNPTIPVCFWCGQDKNEVALMGKIDKEDSEVPRKLITNYEPCDKCKELFSKGIHVIGVTEKPIVEGMFPIVKDNVKTLYPTGAMFVATEDWTQRFLTANEQEDMIPDVLEEKTLLMPDTIVNEIVRESKVQEMEVNIPEEFKEGVQEDADN